MTTSVVSPAARIAYPLLRCSAALEAASDEAIRAICAASTTLHVAPGRDISAEAGSQDGLFIVVRGKVKLAWRCAGGDRLVGLLGPGDSFGEWDLLDPEPQPMAALAVGPAVVLAVDADLLRAAVTERPELGLCLLRLLARRLRLAHALVADCMFDDAGVRVAKHLLMLGRRFGVVSGGGQTLVRHDLTQTELAQLIGISRESVNRILHSFAARGWIRVLPKALVIERPDLLARRAGRAPAAAAKVFLVPRTRAGVH